MNAQSKIEPDGLSKLRLPFPDHQISKLPKETGAQAKQRKADQDNGKWPPKCPVCEGYHHPKAVHLDYVGHAAATDRLLDADPRWNWEPVADPASLGLPMVQGGMWIKLTVDGMSRYGFGDAGGKTGGDAIKEVIGDAIRNAGMRFGMALDLWHKGDLHLEDETEGSGRDKPEDRTASSTGPEPQPQGMPDAEFAKLVQLIEATKTDRSRMLKHFGVKDLRFLNQAQYSEAVAKLTADLAAMAKAETNSLAGAVAADLEDSIPY